jgi:hypothetical protein
MGKRFAIRGSKIAKLAFQHYFLLLIYESKRNLIIAFIKIAFIYKSDRTYYGRFYESTFNL